MPMTVRDVIERATAIFDGGGIERRPPRYPEVAVEIAPDRITGLRVTVDRKNGRPQVRAFATVTLPAGAIEPSLIKPNVLAPEPTIAALQEVLARIAPGDHRISVILPDDVARVAILPFATLPRTRRELADLVRFRMAKSLPFKPEEAVVDLTLLGGAGAAPAAVSVLAVFAQRAVIEQYEALFRACGFWPGLVGISTFELYNLFRPRLVEEAESGRDAALLNVNRHYLSVLIFRGADLIFYRCKPHVPGAAADAGATDVRREIYTSLAFYQEKLLGRGIGRAFLRVCGLPREAVREAVAAETGVTPALLDLEQAIPAGGFPLRPEDAALALPAAGAAFGRRA